MVAGSITRAFAILAIPPAELTRRATVYERPTDGASRCGPFWADELFVRQPRGEPKAPPRPPYKATHQPS